MSRISLMGQNYLVFLRRDTGLPWHMALGIPSRELYQPLRDVLIQVVLVILFAALFSFAIASHASRRIYRVITDLVTGARRVSQGDLKYRIRTDTDPDTGIVVDTFNDMVKSLYGQRLQLKHQLVEIINLKQYNDSLLRSILNAVVAVDDEGIITTFNPASERIFSLPREKVEGKHWTYLLPYVTGGTDTFKEIFTKFLTATDQRIQITNTEERAVPANINSSILYDEDMKPRGLVTVWRDLSLVINLEKQLTRSSKLASLGEMSARVAHEINNPLAVISGHAQILNIELSERGNKENHRQALDEITNQCQRIAKIVRQISEYSKPSKGTMKSLDVNSLLRETVDFSRFIASKNADIITDLEDPLPLVYGDPDQLTQVFTNLVNNAAQAFEKGYGGVLRISTRWRRVGDADVEWVTVNVVDNGKGISREHLDMIFDPFFSTKSEGTGLGLAISQTIIEQHGGTINVESEKGEGTTVTIELPIEKRKAKLYEKPAIGTKFSVMAENEQKEE